MTWFPLEDGCVLYSCHINTIHGNIVGMRVTEAETAMNIAKLQYCQSVTDINHDYMVVDVFTDSTGYNNTINATDCSFNLCYCGTILQCVGANSARTATFSTVNNMSVIGTRGCSNLDDNLLKTQTDCVYPGITPNIYQITFCVNCFVCSQVGSYENTNRVCAILCISNFYDNCTISCGTTRPFNYCINVCNRYDILKINSVCWDLYKNCCCLCQIQNLNCFCCPTFYGEICGCRAGGGSGGLCAAVRVCIYCLKYCSNLNTNSIYTSSALTGHYLNKYNYVDAIKESVILTCPISYLTTINSIFLSTDKAGTGTVVYNVYDATTDTLIGENLLPNTLNTLDCCVQCHRYEIIQCSDGVSCIKSYAIVTGVY